MDEIILSLLCILFYVVIKLTDSKPNKVKYYCKWYMYYIYVLIVTTLLSIGLVWRGRNIKNMPLIVSFLKPMCKFHGITWHLENEKVLEVSGRAVVISNHQSSLDLLGMFHSWHKGNNLMAAGKRELLYAGPSGLVAYLSGLIFIDRRNPKKAYEALNNTVQVITNEEMKLWMFPEGTRNLEGKEKLLPFKKGAFFVAIAAQAPIIPVVFSPYYFVNDAKYIFNSGGHVIMRCLEPISTTGLTIEDVPALQSRLYNIVLHAYEELSKEVFYKFASTHSIATKER